MITFYFESILPVIIVSQGSLNPKIWFLDFFFGRFSAVTKTFIERGIRGIQS